MGVDIYAEFANVIAGLTPRWLDDDVEELLGSVLLKYANVPVVVKLINE